jgi:hypothetical protein
MSDDAAEYLRLVGGLGAQLLVEVLQLDLLAAEVVRETAKGRGCILFALFIVEGICEWSVGVALQATAVTHGSRCAFAQRLTSVRDGSPLFMTMLPLAHLW